LNLPYTLAFGLTGGICGWLLHGAIQRKTATTSSTQRILAIACSAVIPAALHLKYQLSGRIAIVYGILSIVLVAISVFDLRTKVIPHMVTVPGTFAGIAASTLLTTIGFRNSAIGMFLGAGIVLFTTLVQTIRRNDVGGGDWKLAAMIGSFLGVHGTVVAMFSAGCIGLAGGLILLFREGKGKPMALGPYLSAGAILAMFWT
jgi:leader peptidase (prepilin peptidase)/N-methyltransferase